MKRFSFLLSSAVAFSAHAAPSAGEFRLLTDAFDTGQAIPTQYAYCMPDGQGATKPGGNVNPGLRWADAPAGTKSYALIMVDPDVPASFESANKAGKTIPAGFPRQDFYHWVLFDIPASVTGIEEGRDSQKVIPEGKPIGETGYGITGPNSYGPGHGGYDGPCPPWNDERLHHYHFILYALDVETLGLSGPLEGKLVQAALKNHILAKTEIVGTYTNNPALLKQ